MSRTGSQDLGIDDGRQTGGNRPQSGVVRLVGRKQKNKLDALSVRQYEQIDQVTQRVNPRQASSWHQSARDSSESKRWRKIMPSTPHSLDRLEISPSSRNLSPALRMPTVGVQSFEHKTVRNLPSRSQTSSRPVVHRESESWWSRISSPRSRTLKSPGTYHSAENVKSRTVPLRHGQSSVTLPPRQSFSRPTVKESESRILSARTRNFRRPREYKSVNERDSRILLARQGTSLRSREFKLVEKPESRTLSPRPRIFPWPRESTSFREQESTILSPRSRTFHRSSEYKPVEKSKSRTYPPGHRTVPRSRYVKERSGSRMLSPRPTTLLRSREPKFFEERDIRIFSTKPRTVTGRRPMARSRSRAYKSAERPEPRVLSPRGSQRERFSGTSRRLNSDSMERIERLHQRLQLLNQSVLRRRHHA